MDPDGPKSGLLIAAIVAGAFAWYCRRTLDLQVRLIGAREHVVALRRLDGMITAYQVP